MNTLAMTATQALNKMIDEAESHIATEGDYTEGGASMWINNNSFWHGAKIAKRTLPPGTYRASAVDGIGPGLFQLQTETDSLLELDDSISKQVIQEFKSFWTLKDTFTKYGFLHKRGYLFHGPAGSGKSSTIALMLRHIVQDYKGIGLYIDNPDVASACFQLTRRIEKDRPIIAVMEDMDALIHRYGEPSFLAMLDGEAQVDNVVYVATTNYMQHLDPRISNRPSRFDRRIFVDLPEAKMREAYFKSKAPDATEEELKQWVSLTDRFSFAHLREFIVSVRCFGKPVSEVAKELSEMNNTEVNSDDYRPKKAFGFARS